MRLSAEKCCWLAALLPEIAHKLYQHAAVSISFEKEQFYWVQNWVFLQVDLARLDIGAQQMFCVIIFPLCGLNICTL